ncbi:hypothetical protein KFU94_49400 [Chloroflexi bacterium TSY]|nr:hypothetical protein [Chloroflexi bacterium TSY]
MKTQNRLIIIVLTTLLAVGNLIPVYAEAVSQGTTPIPNPVALKGPLQAQETVDDETAIWKVAGVPVTVTRDTRIIDRVGPVVIGAWLKVGGSADGEGGIVAHRIKVVPPAPFVRLIGRLDAVGDTALTVAGINVNIGPLTVLPDDLTLNQTVAVKATLDTNNALLALIVRQRDDENEEPPEHPTRLIGRIQKLPDRPGLDGRWMVSGVPVAVTEDTQLRRHAGPFLIGAWVIVDGEGVSNADGESGILARRIRTTRTHRAHILYGLLEGRTDGTASAASANGQVIVSKIAVDLAPTPDVIGDPQIGDPVRLESRLQDDGTMLAFRLVARESDPDDGREGRFSGVVKKIEEIDAVEVWTIRGRRAEVSFIVTEETEIDEHKGEATVGATVTVYAVQHENERLRAVEIVVREPADDDDHGGIYLEFIGELTGLPEGTLVGEWEVSGRKVVVSEQTILTGEAGAFQIGALVKVQGYLPPEGPVRARKIKLERPKDDPPNEHKIRFVGEVQSRPEDGKEGTWRIGGRAVEVVAETEIDTGHGPATVGAIVKVTGVIQADNSVLAAEIKTLRPDIPDDAFKYTEFRGKVASLPDHDRLWGIWKIIDATGTSVAVAVVPGTWIDQRHGKIEEGTPVKVEGITLLNESVIAFKINSLKQDETNEPEEVRFSGLVVAAPTDRSNGGKWRVLTTEGKLRGVVSNDRTQFENGKPKLGDFVEVAGILINDTTRATLQDDMPIIDEDGVVLALHVRVIRPVQPQPEPQPTPEARFVGRIVQLPDNGLIGTWIVSDVKVMVTDETELVDSDSGFAAGDQVEVSGIRLTDGSFAAKRIKKTERNSVSTFSYSGEVIRIPDGLFGEWTLGNSTGRAIVVLITKDTKLNHDARFAPGRRVRVKGIVKDDGTKVAEAIELIGRGDD